MASLHIRHSERGFSLVEVLVVASLSMVLMAMALVQINASRAVMNADNAMRLVMGELGRARDMAIQQRRFMRVAFVIAGNELRVERRDIGLPIYTQVRRAILEGNLKFALPSGTPDTTDGFGAGSALDFDSANPASEVCFNGDGMMVNCLNGQVINGTVFLAAPNDPYATRAVTVLGSTGRVRGFRRLNTTWGRV